MEFWLVTIWDGNNEIDHLFFDGKEGRDVIIKYMIWLTYKDKRWDFANDVLEGDDVVIAYVKDSPTKEVCLYCCNHIPDVTIERKDILLVDMKYELHRMHTIVKEI